MKFWEQLVKRVDKRRAPQGARGLKYDDIETKVNAAKVAPRKGRVG